MTDLLLLSMYLMLICVSFTLSSFIIIIAQKYFLRNNYVDKINNRSSHFTIATRSGGFSIFLTLFLISVYFYLTGFEIYQFSLLVPLSIIMIIGLYAVSYTHLTLPTICSV